VSDIQVTRHDAIAIIQINRPAVRNAINRAAATALREAWMAFDADDSLRVGILTGGDDVFCAGADLNDFEALAQDVESEHGPLGFARLSVSKPTIAAVAGYCVAGGLEMALWCDLRVADDTAIFGCFERRFGVPLIDGGTQRLPRVIGLGRALEMILTGRAVSAQEAHHWGLVNEVVARGMHLERAIELAQLLAQFPQICLRNDRKAVYAGLGTTLPDGLRIEAQFGKATIDSGESLAGAKAFGEGKGRGGQID
jgi:enoyl-CoA hydratase